MLRARVVSSFLLSTFPLERNRYRPDRMLSTFLSFLRWLHGALIASQLDTDIPSVFILPDLTRIEFIYNTSVEDEGRELVKSIVLQYIRPGSGKHGIGELARSQYPEHHFLRMLRLRVDLSRFAGKTLVIPMSPWSTPIQAIQNAIDFVHTHFHLTDTCSSFAGQSGIHP